MAAMSDRASVAKDIAKRLNISTVTLDEYVNGDCSPKEPATKLLTSHIFGGITLVYSWCAFDSKRGGDKFIFSKNQLELYARLSKISKVRLTRNYHFYSTIQTKIIAQLNNFLINS